ncbi:hypothetical protein C922_02737 [Plasmodium inui San Antonio 1]|uniref:Uncharacterized protein n=1 Tax=Plasmodium inui San Antonio 1 TaxID=1237626 RepID=W7A0Q0_9APIC|nr:hypothetical protein C922_02737 [Plasmodium inui San Antonio 1]EUD66752.1 hypothetical protein C922_02737 [Plasmodium inui San Antonio 1]
MYYQREIIKWIERKSKLEKGKRSGRYVLLRFKRAVRESLLGELLCEVSLDAGVKSPAPGQKLITVTARGIGNDSLGWRDSPGSLVSRRDPPKECISKECISERLPKVHLLKRTIQNFSNLRRLLGRNDRVYADLARVFSQELQGREQETLHRYEKDEPNDRISRYDHVEYLPSGLLQRATDTLDIVDLVHLFNFYISIEWHRFNFLILILRCIISMGNMADTKQETCLKLLESCANLRIEIEKNLKSQKGGSIFTIQKGSIHWGKFDRFELMPNRVPSIRVSPGQVKRLSGRSVPTWRHSPKGLHNTVKLRKRGKNALRSFPVCRRSHHFQETYAKWMKRRFKSEMDVCNGLIEQCAYLVLGRSGQLNDADMKYVKVLRRGGLYLNGGDSSNSFTNQLADYVNAKCECLPPDELITWVDYLTKARRDAKRRGGTGVDPKAGKIKLTRAITRINQHLCASIQRKTNEYSVGEVCRVLSLCARNKHYDENLLDGITAYVVDNLDQVSSRRLTRLAINIHDKLGYTRNEFLLAIVNRYRPPPRRGAHSEGSSKRRGKRTDKRWSNKTDRRCFDKIQTIRKEENAPPETVPRRDFQSVKIRQLLRFLKVLIKNDIHLDEEWADYFLSLMKKKFTHIRRGQHLQNQIAKVPIPTCEEMKEEIIPFVELTQPNCELEVILDETDQLSSNKGGETACLYNVPMPGGAAPPNQQKSVQENCPTRVTSPVGGQRNHRGDSHGETNHPHLAITYNTVTTTGAWTNAPERGPPRQTPLQKNNIPNGNGGRRDPPFGEHPMKKQTQHESNYFENLANARNILLAIQIVLLHLAEEHPNGCLEDGPPHPCLSSRLNELTLTQLSLLHRTYALCSSYIDSSLSAQRSLNNQRVTSSSRLHKQVMSILAHVHPQGEILSEFVHHPFQVDICLGRKPC